MSHVLILSLGPVQDFISAARRTRDLWFGSWMLSELARAAGRSLAGEPGGELIFPDPGLLANERDEVSFANKLVARVEDPSGAAERARAAIDARREQLRGQAFAICQDDPDFVGEVAVAQIADLIELYWASSEIGRNGYGAARRRADQALVARRRTRLWGPASWGSDVPKSAIDGQRESVIHERVFDPPPAGSTPAEIYRRFRADDNERLCGVSLLKRLGIRRSNRFSHHFLSTGHLAAGPLLERLRTFDEKEPERKAALTEAWNALVGKLGEQRIDLTESKVYTEGHGQPILGAIDASILFESRLPDFFPDLRTRAERRRAAEPLAKPLRDFLKVAEIHTPCPYYAVLMADGDRMGDAIESHDTPSAHQDLSRALGRFSETARGIVERNHRGELVYAGGDDVLAFVPLHRAIRCAKELEDAFKRDLKPLAAEGTTGPTLSVGIGIGHFLEPLSRVLEFARSAERKAKETRNALAIRIEKRSGAPLVVSGPWSDLPDQMEAFVELLVEGRLPDRAAFDLRDLARLVGRGDDPRLQALGRAEAERILRRKQPGSGWPEGRETFVAEADRIDLLGRFDALADRLKRQTLTEFSDRLVAARLFATAAIQAAPPREPKWEAS